MSIVTHRLAWLRSGLFWRTFFLLAFLIAASMATWIVSIRALEREPRARQIAAQVISVVTITRAALTHSAPELRRELLFDLASNEGIRIYPREETDQVAPAPASALLPDIQSSVRSNLGDDTRFAGMVNDVAGFWVSFKIDDDEYWLMLDRDRLVRTSGIQWLSWGTVTLLLSLIGAVFISGLINQPLAGLTAAARAMANGQQPVPLPETGPTEIREVNRTFNQTVDALSRIESDRAVILAGISHDLRTPLARMQLEVEMAHLDQAAREGMQSDLAQMDAIIGQFLDYARPTDVSSMETVDISSMLAEAAHEAGRIGELRVSTMIDLGMTARAARVDLKRVVNNLIENARRYGATPGTDKTDIDLVCRAAGDQIVIEIGDHGEGVPASEIDRLLRPFTRLDTARGQANGSGLGLAIVDRIVTRHGGKLRLFNREGGGLIAQISLARIKGARAAV
ncbi:MAG: HAMP domain-containing protein [Herminiimonas sp.]|nr:HAMP domain-containing protein [Herminiimonas sp.]